MSKKAYLTKDGHIKESAIKEAQEIIEAMMDECDLLDIFFSNKYPITFVMKRSSDVDGESLAELYVNRLHELTGTEAPPF